MTETLNQLAVPMIMALMGLLVGALAWGIQREPRAVQEAALKEIAADDPVMADPVSEVLGAGTSPSHDPLRLLSQSIMVDRRFVRSLWGNNAPDMLVIFGHDHTYQSLHNIPVYEFLWLPFHLGRRAVRHELRNAIRDALADTMNPELSLEDYDVAYLFTWMPEQGRDLIIEMLPHEDSVRYRFFTSDQDGKLQQLDAAWRDIVQLTPGEHWEELRKLHNRRSTMNLPGSAAECLHNLLHHPPTQATGHAWMGYALSALKEQRGAQRHLAMALELEPRNLVARLASASLRSGAHLEKEVARIVSTIRLQGDHDADTGFLVVLSLMANYFPIPARMICRDFLTDCPTHEGLGRLMRKLDQEERGAET